MTQEWASRYDIEDNKFINYRSMAVDGAGNSYVTGSNGTAGGTEITTVKYSPAGEQLWVAVYRKGVDDMVMGIAVDDAGGVYLAGKTSDDCLTIRYDASTGAESWVRIFDGVGGADRANAIAVDGNGGVYVTGLSQNAQRYYDYLTIRYSADGTQSWVSRYNAGGSSTGYANAVAVDASGGVYVTGWSYVTATEYDFVTIRYTAGDGGQAWASRYDGGAYDEPAAIAVDGNGGVYVTGKSSDNYATVRYDAATGRRSWASTYDGGGADRVRGIAVDGKGGVYVTGESFGSGTFSDFATVRYAAADGTQSWVSRYNSGRYNQDFAAAIAVDASGGVFVTGHISGNGTPSDIATVGYSAADGAQSFEMLYEGEGESYDTPYAIAVDGMGGVVVAGRTGTDFLTVKYSLPGSQVSDQAIAFNTIGDRTLADDPLTLMAVASSGLPVSFSVLSGPASLSGNQVTFTATGTVTVRASQAGNQQFSPAPDVEQTFHVTKASQTIYFDAVPDKTLGDPDFALAATASSGLPVKFEVLSGPATISGNLVSLTGTGTVAIEATQGGNGEYEAAETALKTFTVSAPAPAIQVISFQEIPDMGYTDAPILLQASATSGLPVSFEIVSGPATVAGSALTVTGTGNVSVRALQPGNSTYAPASPEEQDFVVEKALQVITFKDIPDTAPTLDPIPLYASASSGLPVSFRVKQGPVTVEGNQLTLTGGVGIAVVEAIQQGNENYRAALTVEQSFEVVAGPKALQSVLIQPIEDKTFGDAPFAVSSYATSGLPVVHSVVTGPATVSGDTVTLTGAGTVTVRATQAGDFYYSAASHERSFTVHKALQDIILPLLPDETYGDGPFTLGTTATSGLPLTWEVVSGPATVSGNVLTLTGAGTVTVRATQEGNVNYLAAAPWEYTFEVGKAPQTVSFAPVPAKALGDAPFMLSATASSGLPVSFSLVSGPATVSGNTVTLTGAGTVVVRARQEGDANYQAATPVEQRFEVRAGGIFWEYYMNPPAWADLPSGKPIPADYKPTGSRILPSFATPINFGHKYSSRARGYVIAPVSGEYIFYIAGDDKGELWLSPDETTVGKRLIAHVTGRTAPLQYDKYRFQTSKPVYLRAGQRYYIEALHRENMGGDHLSVGWTMPGGVREQVISGQYLEPYVPEAGNLTGRSAALTKAASGTEVREAAAAPLLAYPNPFFREMTVAFSLEEAQERVVVEILTVHGQLLETLHNGKAEPGVRYAYTFNGERYSNGMYLCRMTYKDKSIYRRIVLAR